MEFGNDVALALTGSLRALQESIMPTHQPCSTKSVLGEAKNKWIKLSGCRKDSDLLMSLSENTSK